MRAIESSMMHILTGWLSSIAWCKFPVRPCRGIEIISDRQAPITILNTPKLDGVNAVLLLLPGILLQVALIMVFICHGNSGSSAASTDLLGIRLETTTFSDEAWRVGHRAGIFYGWLLVLGAILSLILGVWLLQRDSASGYAMGSVYVTGTLIGALALMRWMVLAAHQAARKVVIQSDIED